MILDLICNVWKAVRAFKYETDEMLIIIFKDHFNYFTKYKVIMQSKLEIVE